MKIKRPTLLLFSIVISWSAGIIGSIFTFYSIPNWYVYLNKPVLNPPNQVFGLSWSILYTLMGVSLYLFLLKDGLKKENKDALTFFGIQLFLNAFWTIIFFGLREIFLGLLLIILLWFMIFITIIKFIKVDKISGLLLIPYLLWVAYASYLNFNIWLLNK